MFEPIMNVDVWLLSELLVPGTQIPLNVVFHPKAVTHTRYIK